MLIAEIYDPVPPHGGSAEENIMSNDLKDLYDEVRRIIFDTKVVISPLKTKKGSPTGGKGTTGAVGLAETLNKALKIGLESCNWTSLQAPGSQATNSLIDWYKAKPSGLAYGPAKRGIGLEVQFGNNYQFNEDIKRLSEASLAGYIEAGVSIVSSDRLAAHKADRGAFVSDAKSKLDRHLESLAGARARRFPAIVIIGVEHDDYNGDPYGYFEITPVKVHLNARGVIETAPDKIMTNADHPTIKRRREARQVVGGEDDG